MTILLFATTGFTLYKHYCFKEQKQEVTFMIDEDNCGHHDLNTSSCHTSETITSDHEENCCNHESDYFVLNEPVLKPEKIEAQKFFPVYFIENPKYFTQELKTSFSLHPQHPGNFKLDEFSLLYGVFLL